MSKKILLCIADYKGYKNDFFNKYTSVRNKEFADHQNYDYIEIRKSIIFRNNPNWQKLYYVKKFIDDGVLKEGDIITVIDADMAIVDGRHDLTSDKPFTYAICSCNTHCMGYFSIKICDWSINLINSLLDENNYKKYIDDGWWQAWGEQSSFYYLCGIPRHSEIPFTELPNYGFGMEDREETIYTVEELLSNIEIKDVHYNSTWFGESLRSGNKFYMIKTDYDKIVIRHWGGAQPWEEEFFHNPLKK